VTSRVAIITGITGQDGWYLSELLLSHGVRVVGTSRDPERASLAVQQGIELARCDFSDQAAVEDLLREVRPSHFFNLAGYTSGAGMFDNAVQIGEANGLAVARILEAIKAVDPQVRFCQASTSEMFGEPQESPQSEATAFRPRSPYGAAKVYAHEMVGIYRKRYGLFATSAILFNHESPRRGHGFVTRRISHGAAQIKLGAADELVLGDLEGVRDWGFSGDYVEAMWRMLEDDVADDYVLATGRPHSVRDLCRIAFEHVGLDYADHVRGGGMPPRPPEPVALVGDPAKARERLGWQARVTVRELMCMMVDADLEQLRAQSTTLSPEGAKHD
jgi:GDPmannose 4,6-dehydratase